MWGGFYAYRSYYQAEIRFTNASGKQVQVTVEWKNIDHEVLAHIDAVIEPGSRQSFTFLPEKKMNWRF